MRWITTSVAGERAGGTRVVGLLALAAIFLSAAPALATSARFANTVPQFGFDPTTIGGLPTLVIDEEDLFLDAGDPISGTSFDVDLIGSTNICVLAAGSSSCLADPNSLTGPYSALVSLEVSVNATQEITGPFTLFLSALGSSYDPSEVTIELNPTAPAGLDTSAVPGFVFDPSNGVGGFDPFVAVRDETFAGLGTIYDYVGWTVQDGDLVTFRYDVSTGPAGRGAPQLFANATPAVIPEPGPAILLGLGLTGLASVRRRAV